MQERFSGTGVKSPSVLPTPTEEFEMKHAFLIALISTMSLSAFAKNSLGAKAIQMFEDNQFEPIGTDPLELRDLKGRARTYFKEVDMEDYPADAAYVTIDDQKVIEIYEGNDGGASVAYFDRTGKKMLASCNAGESTPWECSAD